MTHTMSYTATNVNTVKTIVIAPPIIVKVTINPSLMCSWKSFRPVVFALSGVLVKLYPFHSALSMAILQVLSKHP